MAPVILQDLSPDAQYAVAAFRAAADQVHHFFWPVRDHQFGASLFRETEPDTAELIPEPTFRSLAMAVRLAYMASEKGSFAAVSVILRRVPDTGIADRLARIEKDSDDTLTGRRLMSFQTPTESYSPRDVLDTWLYAQALHQDGTRQVDVVALRDFEPMTSIALQLTVRQLAIAILNLDSLLRYAVGEAQRDFTKIPSEDISTGLLWDAV